MKKHCIVAMVVGLCLVAGVVMAGDETSMPIPAPAVSTTSPYSTVTSDEMARGFLSNPAVAYDGWFNFRRIVGPVTQEVQGSFSMDSRWFITELQIDGYVVVSPGNEPLAGLPENGEGSCTNFYLSVVGLTAEGSTACWGDFQTELLRDGDPIVVQLRPSSVKHSISFALPDGVPSNQVALRLAGQFDWPNYYNDQVGGFEVWTTVFDPSDYEIFNVQTGEIYRRGTIGNNDVASQTQSVISLQYQGGVQPLFDRGSRYNTFDRQQLDGSVIRDKVIVASKVYIADLGGQGADISVQNGLALGGRVEVLEWRQEGEMPLITWSDGEVYSGGMGKAYEWVSYRVNIPAGYGRVMVVVYGNVTGANGFSLYAGINGKG